MTLFDVLQTVSRYAGEVFFFRLVSVLSATVATTLSQFIVRGTPGVSPDILTCDSVIQSGIARDVISTRCTHAEVYFNAFSTSV